MSVVQSANAAGTDVSVPATSTLPAGGAVPSVSRRSVLVNSIISAAAIATATAVAGPCLAQEPDPIFAAIEAHRAAMLRYMEWQRKFWDSGETDGAAEAAIWVALGERD